MDIRGRELDLWKELVKKTVNAKAKTLLQLLLGTHKIDVKCFQKYKLAKKKKKTLKRINSLTLFLLTYLMVSISNNILFTRARSAKKTRTTKEVFDAIRGKDRLVVTTLL